MAPPVRLNRWDGIRFVDRMALEFYILGADGPIWVSLGHPRRSARGVKLFGGCNVKLSGS